MAKSDQNQEPKANQENKTKKSLWLRVKPKIKPGNVLGAVFVVVFSIWFFNDPSYEPLLGILTGITALLSFGIDRGSKDDWFLVGMLLVVAVLGIFFIRRANDPEEVIVAGIFYDGVEDQEGDEYVVIRNQDTEAIQLEGWTLHDNQSNHVYTFPMYEMQPGEECRIYTNENHPEWCGFNFRYGGSGVWNNDGDMATLRNAEGMLIDSSIDLIMAPEGEAAQPVSDTAETPTPTLSPNKADEDTTSDGIEIVYVNYDGDKGDKEPDEYVEILNEGTSAVQLEGWMLSDENDNVFDFPDFEIDPEMSCRIYTNEEHADWCGFNYKKENQAIWANQGECATLMNSEGLIMDEYCYP